MSDQHVTLTYDPRVADPNPADGTMIFAGTITDRYVDGGFEFVPANGEQPWTVTVADLDRGHVAIDPKQVS